MTSLHVGDEWWTDYQPVSYNITSKRGDRTQYQKMVDSCHAAGVKVIAGTQQSFLGAPKPLMPSMVVYQTLYLIICLGRNLVRSNGILLVRRAKLCMLPVSGVGVAGSSELSRRIKGNGNFIIPLYSVPFRVYEI